MQTIRRTAPKKLEGSITVESVVHSAEGSRPDIVEELFKRMFGWRRERLGVGLPPRR